MEGRISFSALQGFYQSNLGVVQTQEKKKVELATGLEMHQGFCHVMFVYFICCLFLQIFGQLFSQHPSYKLRDNVHPQLALFLLLLSVHLCLEYIYVLF